MACLHYIAIGYFPSLTGVRTQNLGVTLSVPWSDIEMALEVQNVEDNLKKILINKNGETSYGNLDISQLPPKLS